MKILYLKLVNFANIYTAQKTEEISIDFTQCKNRVILLTGSNGSGKTSILSCLHPFANNGNLDVRNDNSLIRVGKEGYKEIILNDCGNEYIIKHFYTPLKESHVVKSYIMRNGVELNPNGNVTSFKDLVRDELDIEPDYLKLSRLGSNVTNFIDLKTTDRKSFMGKILNEVDIYLRYYKKVTNDMREVKSVISHILDKIQKLNIDKEDVVIDTQKSLRKTLDIQKSEINKLNNELSIINYEIEKYDSPIIIKESLDIKKKELDKIYRVLKDNDMSLDECKSEIDKLEKENMELEIKYNSYVTIRNTLLNQIDKLFIEDNEVQKELSKINDNSDIKDTEFIINELRNRIETRSKECKLIDYNPSYTKKELEELVVLLDRCNDILFTTYELGREPIKKAISYIVTNQNINEYVESNKNKHSKNKLQAMCEYVYNHISKKIGKITPDCKDTYNCGIARFYNEIYDLATESPDEVIEDETFLTYAKLANQNINSVISNIKDNANLFVKLPTNIQDMFKVGNVLNRIENLKPLYDKEIVYAELTKVTEYELQENDLAKLSDMKEKLKLLKQSTTNIDYFENKHNEIINELESLKSKLEDTKDCINTIHSKIKMNDDEKSKFTQLQESISTKDTIENEFSSLQNSFTSIKELYEKKKELTHELEHLEFVYNKNEYEFNNNEYRLTSYRQLNEEFNSYKDTYDDMVYVKNSLSSKEGIPLLYIQMYLKNIQVVTNDLLEIIYGNKLFIENFNITADEFGIPYSTNGTSVKDVMYASQGEKSFISLAISFALIYQSISRYNIMLLDEIDSTLDQTNREKFIQILERQLDMIDADQIFLITHNNMFNMYPVDIISMNNKKESNNKLANYIKIDIK